MLIYAEIHKIAANIAIITKLCVVNAGYLIGPWGGYTATFILVAVILPLIRGKKYNRIRYTLSAIAGALIIDILGMFWLMAQNHLNLQSAFLIGFVPFIPLDLVKSIVAAQIVPAFKNIIKN